MAQLNIRIDDRVKAQFDAFCDDVGLTVSTAVLLFMKKTLSEQKIPFELSSYRPNETTIAAIEEVVAMKQNPQLVTRYSSVGGMMEDLLGEV